MGDTVYRFIGFELDPQRGELRGPDGLAIKLRPKTFEMLRLFATHPGRVLSKQDLMEAVWPNIHVGEDSLFQCVRELRAALGDERRQIIRLASGGGYLLTAPVTADPSVEPSTELAGSDATFSSPAAAPAAAQPSIFGWRGWTAIAAAGVCAAIGLAVAAPALRPSFIFQRAPPVVAVMPIAAASLDPRGVAMAAEVTGRLADGFAKIDNIRIVAPQSANAPATPADFEIRGELQRSEHAWILRARIIKTATEEVQSVATVSVDIDEADAQLQQSRLAAGVGHPLARGLNDFLEASASSSANKVTSAGKVVIEQAIASINQTTEERFGVAQTMLKKALADEPESVDIAVALSSLQLRGIQMRWFKPDEAIAVEAQASATLERALRARPHSIAALETYCRFLSATNRFVESLVTCARILSFDPWNGGALYLIGLGQIFLGRFDDALATFKQADRFDTPRVSRWTWLLGAGWTNILMGRGEEAVPLLQKSIAITAGSGRSHMILAAAYQKIGRLEDARAAMQEGLKLRPGTTTLNVAPPAKNNSPIYLDAAKHVIQLMVDAGLPQQ
ncbi:MULTISPECIES: winged helix-turn-helix domain-containing protein [unclassified Beijerinckia]|uniref:winged helix-turn-helix domain-containing protein n=1 Tax=unclassified Beijerinckia TaxID=2638183 RepID=UPI0008964328|nr:MULTISPECIES: winged helix-turn-helix domain-containing protein [unclassified Beijerinckia]MDH7798170.1 DNA-binding winged helix-turn-helix (wHTH) protein/tetratricopeptide (TPR) repeat protein [Beijerinckia sp. GAS462]SED11543.1 DNA-binding winged helix-turn-helix (wHTH) domain-containing protein [Beijerinckia sp. 28-YEA-48]